MTESGYTPQRLGERLCAAARERGWRPVLGDFARWGAELVAGAPWSAAGRHGAFEFGAERYSYLYHRYKFTWLTERAVEVPIARRAIERQASARLLEVGNVLSHYGPVRHIVIDKYEQAPGVLNLDVTELQELGRFDQIVAISTLEHAGHDEHPRDPDKPGRALQALRAMLEPGGELLVTVPVGYNRAFDAFVRNRPPGLAWMRAMRRLSAGPHWREVRPEEVWEVPYDFLLYSARAVIVASFGAGGG
jgi:SAM-dependent methyltransferase